MLRDSGQLEAIYADAAKGNARAKRVFQVLETDYFPDIGRELAEVVSRPPCLLPLVRESSGWCIPDWSFVDFLKSDRPGGSRLRKALFNGFEERAQRRQLENQLVLSAMNALLGVGVAATAIREAEIAIASQAPRAPSAPGISSPVSARATKGLSNAEVRAWYNSRVRNIDTSGPLNQSNPAT